MLIDALRHRLRIVWRPESEPPPEPPPQPRDRSQLLAELEVDVPAPERIVGWERARGERVPSSAHGPH